VDRDRRALDAAENEQHHDDDQDQAEAAAWVVAPMRAVRPCRESTDQAQDKNDEQNGSKTQGTNPPGSAGSKAFIAGGGKAAQSRKLLMRGSAKWAERQGKEGQGSALDPLGP
jgi:hypothetical protein